MALVLADRVKETTSTTGTGTVTLLGASTGFQSFAAVGNANTTYYTIAGQTTTEWEVGIGTYTASGTTLSRNTVLSSSNSGSLVDFTAGTKDVFVTYPSSRSIYADGTTLIASNSSILPPTSGGTGQNTIQAAMNSFAGAVTSGSYLRGNGSNVVMNTIQAGDVPTLNQNTSGNAATATTAANLANGSAGTIPYQSAAGTTAMLAAGTAGFLLQANGAAAPTWVTAPVANNGTLTLAVSGTGLSGSQTFTANQASNATFTVVSNATNANTVSTIVARDASGNFSAGTITATLSGNASTATSATTATTATTANATATGNSFQMGSLGVGTAASGTGGEIRATNNITAYYSDDRLKTRLGNIENALAKVKTLDTFYYEANETAQALGYKPIREVGISAQQVEAIMPETVAPAPIDDQYLTVRYERLVPLLFAAIKELEAKVALLEAKG
jgi:hypothetical protein